MLSIEDLGVEFRTRHARVTAVQEVSLNLAEGERLGIVGESGSGKSVTAYSVLRLLEHTGRVKKGRITFEGIDLLSLSEREMRNVRGRKIAMIFQNPQSALNPIRPIGQQLEDVLIAHLPLSRGQARRRALDLLELVRIRQPAERYRAYPFELSGGMCQRVMIALAMACEPRLLIADEPATGLDVTIQKIVMDLMAELCSAQQAGLLLITHDLGLASKYCDRIIVMQSGQVVESGATRKLFCDPEHPYTQRLVAATPRKSSQLIDLLPAPERSAFVVSDTSSAADWKAKHLPDARGPLLRVRDLVKTYPSGRGRGRWIGRLPGLSKASEWTEGIRAVDGISFEIGAGESVGLVGESGCGKTTTSRMVARLLDRTAGSIQFAGEDIGGIAARDFNRSDLRRKIQMVFQDPAGSLNPRWTAFDCIAEPLRRLGSLQRAAALRARVQLLAERSGLEAHLLFRFPHQLSGGQQARVGIARAIALDPELLILDEPTSALDVSVQAVVLNQLAKLRFELGLSFLFVSHDLNVVRLMCDRILVMHDGRFVEEGRSTDVLERPRADYTRTLVSAIPDLEFSEDGGFASTQPIDATDRDAPQCLGQNIESGRG